MWCPTCGDEFREGVTHCPDDGAELVSDEAVPRASEPAKVEVPDGYALLTAEWEGPADEFVEWLDDEGIQVIAVTDHQSEKVNLYVPGDDLATATRLLDEYHDEDDDEEYEEVEIEFDVDDLSGRSQELLADGDLDTFGMLTDGPEEEILALADRLEDASVPVLVVDVVSEGDDAVCELHVPERCRDQALTLVEPAG
jgi:hypothetical protein